MLLEKLVLTYCIDCLNGRKKIREEAFLDNYANFLENGSMALEKLVATCNGRPVPIRNFSIKEIALATDNNHLGALHTGYTSWYKGSLEGREISVKRSSTVEEALTDMTISAKMRAHKNVLKLIGCCLETPVPLLVFESTPNQTNLLHRIYSYDFGGTDHPRQRLEWRSRLNIAGEIAHAIAYLHHAFSKPIVHRNIWPRNILLDQHDKPKLYEFSLAIPIPENETQVRAAPLRTPGYMCPSDFATGWITEKADVHSFGVTLLDLLCGPRSSKLRVQAIVLEDDLMAEGVLSFEQQLEARWDLVKDYIRKHDIDEIVDPAILAEAEGACVERQLKAVLDLAVTCMEPNPELRPTMVDVSKKLRWIERSVS